MHIRERLVHEWPAFFMMGWSLLVLACDGGATQSPSPSRQSPPVEVERELEEHVAEERVTEVPAVEVELEPAIEPPTVEEEKQEVEGECCRICRKGMACGDTCIARDRECTVPTGCACNG